MEPAHQIGQVDALGQTRAQPRRTVAADSVAIWVNGAEPGTVLGVGLAVVLHRSPSSQGCAELGIARALRAVRLDLPRAITAP